VRESILFLLPHTPTRTAHTTARLLHDYCRKYDPSAPPCECAIHHTILGMAISCKGQSPRRYLSCDPVVFTSLVSWSRGPLRYLTLAAEGVVATAQAPAYPKRVNRACKLSKPGGGNVTDRESKRRPVGASSGDSTTHLKRSAVMSGTGIHRLIYRDICVERGASYSACCSQHKY